ncbi:MAG: CoA transferase [Acidimicrobiales bacterium]
MHEREPLRGIRLVETASGVAGPYTAKLLGDLGAEVTKVEPPGGDRSRHHGPFPTEHADPERSALFLHLNGAKVLAPPERLDGLLAGADVIVDDGRLLPRLDELRAANPALVVATLTPFGLDGPYRDHVAEDITLYALGGPMIQTGVAEREPLKLAGNQIQYQWGAVGAVATLGALRRAERSGVGAHVDIAGLDTVMGSIDRQINHLLWKQWTGREVTRSPRGAPALLPSGYFPCLDGYIATVIVAGWLPRLLAVLDDPELTERCAAPDWASDPDIPGLLEAGLYVFLADRTRQQAMADAAVHRLPLAPLNGPADLFADPHFSARGFFVERDGDRVPRPPIRFHTDRSASAAAPSETETPSPTATPASAATPCRPMRSRCRASACSISPRCGRGPTPPCCWATSAPRSSGWTTRGSSPPSPGQLRPARPRGAAGHRPVHRLLPRHGPRPATVEPLRQLRGPLALEEELHARRAPGVGPRGVPAVGGARRRAHRERVGRRGRQARPRLGGAARPQPRLVMVRMPSMGLHGPYRDFVGFGMHMEAIGGTASLSGYRDGDPSEKSATYPMDPAAGTHAALATMAALRERDRTGVGLLVEVPQIEVILQHAGELLIEAGWRGENPPPPGNRHVTYAPQGCYRCLGEDRWLVLTVRDDADWRALRTVLGEPPWAADARFEHAAGRRAHHDELDAHLSAWTATADAGDLFARLQAAGIPAAPVQDQAANLADAHLRARRFFRVNRSPEVPPTEMPDHLWRWDGPPLAWGPFNRLGDANEEVFRGLLGLSEDEYAALDAEGHLSLDYLGPDGTPL